MRSQEIHEGRAYALARNDRIKVTVLAHEPRGRVLVRFETGVKAGETGILMNRSIVRPWGTEPTRRPFMPDRSVLDALYPIEDDRESVPLKIGDVVRLAASKTPLEWTIVSVEDSEHVTISTRIFGQQRSRTIAVSELARCQQPREARYLDRHRLALLEPARVPAISDEELKDNLRPIVPRRELDEILDNVLFSTGCLVSYGRRYARGVRRSDLGQHLRDEISQRGFVVREYPGEYGRIRVRHRFDVVPEHCPSLERPATIERLHYPQSQRARRSAEHRSRRQGRHAA